VPPLGIEPFAVTGPVTVLGVGCLEDDLCLGNVRPRLRSGFNPTAVDWVLRHCRAYDVSALLV